MKDAISNEVLGNEVEYDSQWLPWVVLRNEISVTTQYWGVYVDQSARQLIYWLCGIDIWCLHVDVVMKWDIYRCDSNWCWVLKTINAMINLIRKTEVLMSEDEGRGRNERKQFSNLFRAPSLKPEQGLMEIVSKKVPVTQSQQVSHLTIAAMRYGNPTLNASGPIG